MKSRLALSFLVVLLASSPARAAFAAQATAPAAQPVTAAARPTLLVLNKVDATLSFIDPESGGELARVPTGVGPHEVACSADGKLAFVMNYGEQQPGNSIGVYDVGARKELRRIDLGPLARPHGVAEHAGHIWFTAEQARCVARLDAKGERVDWIAGVGESIAHMLVIDPQNGRIWTTNILANSVSVIDPKAGPGPQGLKHIAVEDKPEAIALRPASDELWIGHLSTGALSVIDRGQRSVRARVELGGQPIRVAFTPDGATALVTDPQSGELIAIDAAKREVRERIELGSTPVGILIEPGGARAYVALMGEQKVAVIDLAGPKLARVREFATGAGPDGLAWSGGALAAVATPVAAPAAAPAAR